MNKASVVARGAAIIAAGTLLSRLLGLVRENMISTAFGTSYVAGAFRTAFSVPDLLYYLLAGGALSAVFIPVFSDYLVRGDQSAANRIASSVMNLMLSILAVGVLLEIIFAPLVVRLVAWGYDPHTPTFHLAVTLTRIMCGVILFTAVSGLLSGMLNSYMHFLMPTVVWSSYNLFFIFGIAVLRKMHWHGAPLGIYGVGIGVLLGGLSMALLQIPVVVKYGFRYAPLIDFAHAGVRQIIRLFAPVMFGLSLAQLNLQLIPLSIASFAGPAAVAVIYTANRVVLLPMGIFAVAVATAFFPRMSQQATLGEFQQLRETFAQGMKAIILLIIPSTVAILILAKPMIGLLNGGGEFNIHDIENAAFALVLFTWGLLGLSALQLINRAFFSLKSILSPVIVGALMVGANYLFGWYFTKYTRVNFGGTALATALTTTLAAVVLFELLRRRLQGIGGRDILFTTLKVTLASVVMGAVIYLLARHFAPAVYYQQTKFTLGPMIHFKLFAPNKLVAKAIGAQAKMPIPRMRLLVQIGVSMIAGLLAYFLALRALGVKESSLITDRLLRRFRRQPAISG